MPAASPIRPWQVLLSHNDGNAESPHGGRPDEDEQRHADEVGPASVKQKMRGGSTSIEARSTVRLPNLSARGPIIRVPAAPPKSISVRAVFPSAGDTSSTRS